MSVRAFARALAIAVAVAPVLVVVAATPASAHGIGGPRPTDYQTVVRGITPRVAGIDVRAIDLGSRLQLTNHTGSDVTVLGYQDEPYLRIGPRGVWENTRSPAVFLNRTRTPTSAPPASFDAKATPRWQRISSERTARWHDHRAHWMGGGDPQAVRDDPSRSHVVIRDFRIPLELDGRRLAIRGDVGWVPGPSPWPWIAGAVVVAAAVGFAARTRVWAAVLVTALALLMLGEAVHVVGAWQASTAGIGSRLAETVWSFTGIAIGVVALTWVVRRDAWSAVPAVLVAGVFLAIAGGLADITSLSRSQLPTTLPDGVARATVALALGLGTGVVVGAASHLRMPRGVAAPARVPDRVAR